ncbi:MAG: hypothetical protein QOI04_1214 [Verrucomicrobiota bacterium]|jgi:hypothetical protein
MSSKAFSLLLLLGATVTAHAVIDLTPIPFEYKGEGATFTQLAFKDGPRRLTYELPHGWSYRRAGDRIQLSPPKSNWTEAFLQVVPLDTAQTFDEPTVKALKQLFLSELPSGSQSITIVNEEQNPVLLNGRPSYEVTVSYKAAGQTFLASALCMSVPGSQLIFRLSCPKPEFDAVHRTFRVSVLSCQWLEPASQPQ